MKILIVVDMQKDFIDGSLSTKEALAIVPNVVAKIRQTPPEHIFVTLDTHTPDYLNTCEGRICRCPTVSKVRRGTPCIRRWPKRWPPSRQITLWKSPLSGLSPWQSSFGILRGMLPLKSNWSGFAPVFACSPMPWC